MLSDQELEYKHLDETTSTNDYLRIYSPQSSVTVAVAEYQTHGRGQIGNTWVSERGRNLLFSVLVCPTGLRAGDGFVLSQAMALAIKEVLDRYLSGVLIKWPNDIYCHDCKICGTLIENTLSGAYVARSVIGSGINVNQTDFPDGLAVPPTSVHLQSGHEMPMEDLLRDIVQCFRAYYAEVQQGRYERIRELYHDSLYMKDKQCTFRDGGGLFQGTISHVEPSGHLIILDESMQERRYAFKEVKLVRNDNI
ncbi:MAG: biotin--[acetyl-CoA-carboxylase] ligase [Bacteroides sp.]|nr:biotin--[acetyl-CoA-carboxylase] ligase [Bacteroides sp.]MCM1446626.1 biotin--[acetyl-CoA-carboxylase] ligase [Bacteroides sp.]